MKEFKLAVYIVCLLLFAGCSKSENEADTQSIDLSSLDNKTEEDIITESYVFSDRDAARTYELPNGFRADFSDPKQYSISQNFKIGGVFKETIDCDLANGYVFIYRPFDSTFFICYPHGIDVITYGMDLSRSSHKRYRLDEAKDKIESWDTIKTEYQKRFLTIKG